MDTSIISASDRNIEQEKNELIVLISALTSEEVEKVINRARQLLALQ